MKIFVDVTFADESNLRQEFDQEEVLVGTAADAHLTLKRATELGDYALLLVPRSNGCWISAARDARVRPLVGGREVDNDLIPYGATMDLGSVTLKIGMASSPKRRQRRIWFGACVAVAAAGLWLMRTKPEGLAAADVAAPNILPGSDAKCPDPLHSAELAVEAIEAADSRALRYAYDPAQGVLAVKDFGIAEACAKLANLPEATAAAKDNRQSMAARLQADYKVAGLALERARRARDLRRIVDAARVLMPYVAHHPGEYRDWLMALERRAVAKLEVPAKRKD